MEEKTAGTGVQFVGFNQAFNHFPGDLGQDEQ